jgi:STAS-like domain of unknown function (DUF4325)
MEVLRNLAFVAISWVKSKFPRYTISIYTMYNESKDVLIKVSDWSTKTGWRWITDADDYSGQRYRAEVVYDAYLLALNRGGKLVIDLENVAGYTSSFLSEAFGGLISRDNLDKQTVLRTLEFLPTKFELNYIRAQKELEKAVYLEIPGKSVLETRNLMTHHS